MRMSGADSRENRFHGTTGFGYGFNSEEKYLNRKSLVKGLRFWKNEQNFEKRKNHFENNRFQTSGKV